MSNNQKLSTIDHREINKRLEIYSWNQLIGQGLPFLLPNGVIIRNLIQQFIRQTEAKYQIKELVTPILANPTLYQQSGHLSHYSDYIFPVIEREKENFQLRPMTCPHHCTVFKEKIRSYRELPLWYCEHSILHRFESSGSLKGIERARWMELSDNHVFLAREDLINVFKRTFAFISEILSRFKIKVSRFVCSLHDNSDDKYHGDQQLWKDAENSLVSALESLQINFIRLEGEAAFYGPKLDIEVTTTDGKNITFATIQIDFLLPKSFQLAYVGRDGKQQQPIIIHYSSIGSYQRFISILLEQSGGKLPFWLAPLQLVIILTKNQDNNLARQLDKFSENIGTQLSNHQIRYQVWKDQTIDYQIRKFHKKLVFSYLVIGSNELTSEFLTLEYDYGKQKVKLKLKELILFLKQLNEER